MGNSSQGPASKTVIVNRSPDSPTLDGLAARSAVYAAKAFGDGTQRAYRSAWRRFTSWCSAHGIDPFAGVAGPLPLYVTYLADSGLAVSSIRVALAAIATAYRLAGFQLDFRDPEFMHVVEGIVRTKGSRPKRQVVPAVPDVLRAMLAITADCGCDRPARGAAAARDRAMLLLGYGAALRRSELVALTIADTEIVAGRGVRVTVSRSKTDQQGRGQEVVVFANPGEPDLCPVLGLEKWLECRMVGKDMMVECGNDDALRKQQGSRPLFCSVAKAGDVVGEGLSDKFVARLIKRSAEAAGFDSADFSGHSLRAGLATAASEAGFGLADIMRQTRHKSPEVALRYLRPADLWRNNVTDPKWKKT